MSTSILALSNTHSPQGKLGGEEDGLSIPLKEAKMTCPNQAAEFFRETRCDLMAACIGMVWMYDVDVIIMAICFPYTI
ncbi:hypothetical protein EON63_12615 [archaeon]|nr:MAG: hypothetical protein EON63_12615 [archaeon]